MVSSVLKFLLTVHFRHCSQGR